MSCVNCVADVENFVISAIEPSLTFHGRRTSLVRTFLLLLVDMTQSKMAGFCLTLCPVVCVVVESCSVFVVGEMSSTCVVHVCGQCVLQ